MWHNSAQRASTPSLHSCLTGSAGVSAPTELNMHYDTNTVDFVELSMGFNLK